VIGVAEHPRVLKISHDFRSILINYRVHR
jgi:hypothetical protein